MKTAALVVYGLLGLAGVGLGVVVLLFPALALSRDAYSPATAHLVREESALGVFMGLMAFWCILHFERRRAVHFALMVFTTLFAAIHWGDYANGDRHVPSPIINTIPFLALALTIPFARTLRSGEPVEGANARRQAEHGGTRTTAEPIPRWRSETP